MHECGATTTSGTQCKRRVKSGRCYMHDKVCSVCLCELNNDTQSLPCKHVFHTACIDQWKSRGNTTCPYCRTQFVSPYKITITVEGTGTLRTFTPDRIPDILRQFITSDTQYSELVIDVDGRDSMLSILSDLGIQNPHDLF